mmetsp:Transcript_23029/g.54600  ORF Transcript_23029/g.54600 Transcript_23029/m.54600 type:complete len:229 (-) Transcript_23029:784-1470(-)
MCHCEYQQECQYPGRARSGDRPRQRHRRVAGRRRRIHRGGAGLLLQDQDPVRGAEPPLREGEERPRPGRRGRKSRPARHHLPDGPRFRRHRIRPGPPHGGHRDQDAGRPAKPDGAQGRPDAGPGGGVRRLQLRRLDRAGRGEGRPGARAAPRGAPDQEEGRQDEEGSRDADEGGGERPEERHRCRDASLPGGGNFDGRDHRSGLQHGGEADARGGGVRGKHPRRFRGL